MFEQAEWIWKSRSFESNSYGWFFKYVNIQQSILGASLSISAHNHFKLQINGHLVSGYVSPAPSTIPANKLSLTYDVKPFLNIGINLIEVIVLYLGGSGQNYQDGIPGFILEGDIQTQQGTVSLQSDLSWKAYKTIPYQDNMPFQQSRSITPVEFYDQTIERQPNQSHDVVILDVRYRYHQQLIPEGHIYEVIKPKMIYSDEKVKVFDCGRIVSGFPQVILHAKKEEILTLRYSEDLDQHRVKHNVANEPSEHYCDHIKVMANQDTRHAFDFTYKAFRYVEIEGDISIFDVLELRVLCASTKLTFDGYIHSKTNHQLNHLYEMFINTQRNNTLGLLVDCPHREQAQYLGDSALQVENIQYNISERKELIEKVLNDFMYAQYSDGTFPFVAPGSTHTERFSLKIPEYDLYFIELVYQRFIIDFDVQVLEKYRNTVVLLMNHYIQKVDDLGLVKKTSEWHISDWPYPTVDHEGTHLTYENMLYYHMLTFYEKTFDQYGIGPSLVAQKNNLRKALLSHLKLNGLFKDHVTSTSYHQGIQAYGLVLNLFEADEVKLVIEYMKSKGFDASIILGRQVIRAYLMHQALDEAMRYLFEYEKGWGHIINLNQLTMWEGFDDIESHSHAWGLYPVRLIQEYILGIQIETSIKNTYIICPQPVDTFKHLDGQIVTEQGPLKVSYFMHDDDIDFEVNVPNGIKATFRYGQTSILIHDHFQITLKKVKL